MKKEVANNFNTKCERIKRQPNLKKLWNKVQTIIILGLEINLPNHVSGRNETEDKTTNIVSKIRIGRLEKRREVNFTIRWLLL